MFLPTDSIISSEKLTDYLLVFKKENDKSKFLNSGGYALENWEELEKALRNLLKNEAIFQKEDTFGKYYTVSGTLAGQLNVKTIWFQE
ncbi:MAG: hypothetical protein SFV22_06760, partial [Saprospiraceae bacterium]|nr:hypothetical protein [Saprospiraceae bacterium]